MAEDEIYMTISTKRRQPQNDGYVAILTKGQPQLGDKEIVVLTMTILEHLKDAKKWHDQMLKERPWEVRN